MSSNSFSQEKRAAIAAVVDDAASIAQLFLPQFAAFILIGRAVAKAAPELYDDAVDLLTEEEPTVEEKADLAMKLQALANPEGASAVETRMHANGQ